MIRVALMSVMQLWSYEDVPCAVVEIGVCLARPITIHPHIQETLSFPTGDWPLSIAFGLVAASIGTIWQIPFLDC